MNKIPVGQTIAKAYRFAFGDFGAVLGVVWLPVAIMAVSAYFLFRDVELPLRLLDADPHVTAQNVLQIIMLLGGPLRILELVLWVCMLVIGVGLTRTALGIGGRPHIFFTLGPPFWRLLGAGLIFVVIFVMVEIAFLLPFFVLVAIGVGLRDLIGQVWVGILLLVLGAAGFGALVYIYLRLGFLIAPVVIAEEHIDIRRSWHLAKGNVLRILAIVLATMLPVAIALYAAVGAAIFFMFRDLPFGALPDARFFSDHWIAYDAILVILGVGMLFQMALTYGAPAFAYRALVPAKASESAA
jgi:hypothetical protein